MAESVETIFEITDIPSIVAKDFERGRKTGESILAGIQDKYSLPPDGPEAGINAGGQGQTEHD